MADEIKIKVTVDDSQAKTGLKNVQQGLAQTAAQAVKTDSSLGKLSTGSNQAGQSLINLGRIVQDAPFGFIGIQNNINPLLESFQSLKKETGSTIGAFKALGSSLVGGAGIGLAVSLTTSALTLLAQNGFFNAGEKAKKAAEEAKKFNDAIKSIAEDAAKEQANVLVLVKALESETVSRKEKLSAIKELQNINPKYFGDLKLEGELVTGLTSAYEKYKDAIIASIQNKIDVKKLESVLEDINKLTEQQQKFQIFAKSNQERINQLVAAGGKDYARNLELTQEMLTNTDKLTKKEKERDEILARIAERNFAGQTTVELEKTKKATETIADVLAKLGRELDFLSTKELQLGTDEAKAKISAIENAIERLIKDFKVKPEDTIIVKLFGDIKSLKPLFDRIDIPPIKIPTSLEIKEALDKAQKEAQDKLGKNPLIVKVSVKGAELDNEFIKALKERVKTIQKAFDDIAESAARLQSDIFTAIGEGIGNALGSGGNVIQGALEGILHVMGKFLVQLGEAAILSSTLAIAIKNIFKSPIGGLVAGIAAVAVGTILQSIKLPAFAQGGITPGGPVLIGEQGPEILVPPAGSRVIPNHQINQFGGGMAIEVTGTLRAQGSTMVAIIDNARRTNSRNGQAGS